MCDQERACLFLIFLFSHCKDFYPNFDPHIQNSRLYHGVQSLIIYHLRATSNSSRFIWIKKLNSFKIDSKSQLTFTMLFDIQPRSQVVFGLGLTLNPEELCFRLLATKCTSRPWLCRGVGLAVHLSTAHSNNAIIITI